MPFSKPDFKEKHLRRRGVATLLVQRGVPGTGIKNPVAVVGHH
jgi:hypothetical protein